MRPAALRVHLRAGACGARPAPRTCRHDVRQHHALALLVIAQLARAAKGAHKGHCARLPALPRNGRSCSGGLGRADGEGFAAIVKAAIRSRGR